MNEELFNQMLAAAGVMMWLSEQSMQVKVWNN
jgi:hypothetical protein